MSTTSSTRRPAATPTVARTPTAAAAPSSAGPGSASFRTPTATAAGALGGGARRTPGTGGGLAVARTPHARAARQALDSRRTALFTPGGRQSRRKSGRMLRESPRDLLRSLSRRLAPQSQATALSSSPATTTTTTGTGSGRSSGRRRSMATIPEGQAAADNNDSSPFGPRRRSLFNSGGGSNRKTKAGNDNASDSDDSIPLDRPRMSLPIGDDDDDDNDDDLRPHRSAILDDDENFTLRSIEVARRTATQEQLRLARRLSRASLGSGGSLGSIRMSDYIDGFLGGVGGDDDQAMADGDDERVQSAFFPEDAFDHLVQDQPGDTTFERLDSEADERRGTLAAGRESAFGAVDVPLDGNETTFLLGAGPLSPDRTLPAPDGGDGDGGLGGDENVPFDGMDDFGGDNDNDVWFDEQADADEQAADEADGAEEPTVAESHLRATGQTTTAKAGPLGAGGKRLKMSAHGIPYPSLPPGVVKRVAQTFAQSSSAAGRAKLSPDTVAALSKASDWFFEQVGVDLQRYAKHAGRKTIDESDMLLLMRRQRQISASVTPFSLAQRFLPRELVQELRMAAPGAATRRRRPRTTAAGGGKTKLGKARSAQGT